MSEYTPAQALRAFERIWVPISANHDEGMAADAGFDGGEFSGPAHEKLYEEHMDAVMDRVAARFGMTRNDLWTEMQRQFHECAPPF